MLNLICFFCLYGTVGWLAGGQIGPRLRDAPVLVPRGNHAAALPGGLRGGISRLKGWRIPNWQGVSAVKVRKPETAAGDSAELLSH